MADLEKVIKGLDVHCTHKSCLVCPYDDRNVQPMCLCRLMTDALELLKEQEPIPCGQKIKAGDVMLEFFECGYCKNAIRKPWEYCPFCGKAVKWE